MKVHFHFSEALVNALTWEEYEVLELAQEGELKLHRARPLMARFMVSEQLEPLSHAAAMKLLARIPMTEIGDVLQQFMSAIRDATVPKVSGDSLPPPSEAKLEESPSPVGSTP